ncbi:hypothetical protein L596_003741 [Steinernema carpocapsae]|uniref:Uncharacterized protein n=1 Tax=Steinernema carpocapsae TaxID=34508 RepID=A0A4U8UV54_STECR|nr:hypothetical protein L596_003741 [Steinernema carpocapsae]
MFSFQQKANDKCKGAKGAAEKTQSPLAEPNFKSSCVVHSAECAVVVVVVVRIRDFRIQFSQTRFIMH